ncbi:DUF2306 domain-containing protein [Solimonas sp. K1W22B-7]|uniref:DUF2306 domain-containing protein n=1 Tax=Solimonas sp. K1W22B-7 TaxID=2303331 RepID=UPI000E32E50E|nr:DUF2306 domain-containing protein [Solimonas sp. K1W22B-7]AXQ27970.1 DUF2306 domain-containing protein [Solimonas sp. K1W22B-7]
MTAILSTAGIIHLATVVPALGIGAAMLLQPKGTAWHKRWGRAWVLLMVVADLSSFWLRRDGYSWIHVLAIVNLASIAAGVAFIRARRRVAHAAFVIGAYSGAVAAGIGALAPGRFLHQALFGG